MFEIAGLSCKHCFKLLNDKETFTFNQDRVSVSARLSFSLVFIYRVMDALGKLGEYSYSSLVLLSVTANSGPLSDMIWSEISLLVNMALANRTISGNLEK